MLNQHSQSGRVLVNSLPKSGTHLLTQAVELFSYADYADSAPALKLPGPLNFDYREVKNALAQQGQHVELATSDVIHVGSLSPVSVNASLIRRWLARVPQNQYIVGHITYSPALPAILSDLDYRHLFIIRDPRAVLPSLLSFILNPEGIPKKHFLEADLKQMSQAQRLDFILQGGYAPKAGVEVKSFAEVYRAMLAWCNQSSCLAIRFEDLIGVKGGGSQVRQKKVVEEMAHYLQCPFDDAVVTGLQAIYNPAAPTFRLGQVDSWMSAMAPDIIERLTDYCKPLCKAANY